MEDYECKEGDKLFWSCCVNDELFPEENKSKRYLTNILLVWGEGSKWLLLTVIGDDVASWWAEGNACGNLV